MIDRDRLWGIGDRVFGFAGLVLSFRCCFIVVRFVVCALRSVAWRITDLGRMRGWAWEKTRCEDLSWQFFEVQLRWSGALGALIAGLRCG